MPPEPWSTPKLGNAGGCYDGWNGRLWIFALSLKDPAAVQGKLCRRMEKHIKELAVFVA